MAKQYRREKSQSNLMIQLIRKLSYIVYCILAVLGIGLIIWACVIGSQETGTYSNLYNVLVGIGCSLIASAVVSAVITAFLPDRAEKYDLTEEWGLEDISVDRSDDTMEKLPAHNLDIVAFGLTHFRQNISRDLIRRQVENGLYIRVLIPDSRSIFVKEQQKRDGDGNLKTDIDDLIKWLNDIETSPKCRGKIEYRVYNSLPLDFYCRRDDLIYIGSYIPHQSSNSTITYKYSAESRGGRYYSNLFTKLWDGESDINFVSVDSPVFSMDQNSAVKFVLEYFCGLLQKGASKCVVGIVVVFKGNLRRTFYSCNKKDTHNCHFLGEGSVGVMCRLNGLICPEGQTAAKTGSSGKPECVYFFCDYENHMAFSYEVWSERVQKIKRLNDDFPEKMETSSEAVAILASPLQKEEKIIGALTFDFAVLPPEYLESVQDLRKILSEEIVVDSIPSRTDGTVRGLQYLKNMFEEALSANKIISEMMGQYGEMTYGKLYEEEWKA